MDIRIFDLRKGKEGKDKFEETLSTITNRTDSQITRTYITSESTGGSTTYYDPPIIRYPDPEDTSEVMKGNQIKITKGMDKNDDEIIDIKLDTGYIVRISKDLLKSIMAEEV